MNDRQVEGGVALLFADRRQDVHPLVPQLEHGLADTAVLRRDLDAMLACNGNAGHDAGDRAAPIARQPIHAGADEEMRTGLTCRTEELIDVVLPVADIDAALRPV